MRLILRQAVSKKIVDAQYPEVTAWRCEWVNCGHVFRVYPKGVSQKQISKRVNGMAVMIYLLGLSYGAVEIVLNSLGRGTGKTSVYRAVQTVAEQVPGLKRERLLSEYRIQAIGADVTSVRCNGKWVTVGIVVDAVNGMVLRIDGNEILDSTNNHCERAIGWWIKERYRPMKGYKREQSALNVSRWVAFAGIHLTGGLDLADLIS